MNKTEEKMDKSITRNSEELLIRALQAMELTEVKGRENLVHMVNSMDAVREVLKQINAPPEEGEKDKEE